MRVSPLLGRNASCCDFKQLFPRLAGVALHCGTGAEVRQFKCHFMIASLIRSRFFNGLDGAEYRRFEEFIVTHCSHFFVDSMVFL